MKKCPCHSNKSYKECCKPFHRNKILAQIPLSLMRSRYAAYALGLIDYIIDTTHSKSPHFEKDFSMWKDSMDDFSRYTHFLGLTILDTTNQTVTFKAHLMRDGKDVSFSEKSFFEWENGALKFVHGEILPS